MSAKITYRLNEPFQRKAMKIRSSHLRVVCNRNQITETYKNTLSKMIRCGPLPKTSNLRIDAEERSFGGRDQPLLKHSRNLEKRRNPGSVEEEKGGERCHGGATDETRDSRCNPLQRGLRGSRVERKAVMAAIEGWRDLEVNPRAGLPKERRTSWSAVSQSGSCLAPFRAFPLSSTLQLLPRARFPPTLEGIGDFFSRVAPAMGGNQAAPFPTNRVDAAGYASECADRRCLPHRPHRGRSSLVPSFFHL